MKKNPLKETVVTLFNNLNIFTRSITTDYNNKLVEKFKLDEIKENTCIHEYARKKGDKLCKEPISENSKTGKYCKKHLSDETKENRTSKVTKKQELAETKAKIIQELNNHKPKVILKRNNYGNFEHPETKLLFDKVTKEVYGKQSPDSNSVLPLTAEDIESCKLFHFTYKLPENIESNLINENKEESDE